MRTFLRTTGVLFSLSLLSACGTYQALGQAGSSSSDVILTTASDMTLYTFDKDTNGVSACYDTCAAQWPPYLVSEAAPVEAATKTKRNDGSEQWVVNGSPLYTWVGDTKPGDTTGDGVGGVWHTAQTSPKNRYKTTTGYE